MGRNNRASRHSNYVIRIVCEGNKTEPLFFTSLCDLYYKDKVGMDVRTVPQPYVPQDEEAKNSDRGSYKGKKRQVKREKEFMPEEVKITGVPPLKWVQYARNLLTEGVDEAWAVYDKDNHPMHKEALEEANKIIYERNPYTNVDLLVGRLLGKETVDYSSLYQYKEHGHDWSVKLCEDGLIIKNNKAGAELFPKGIFRVYDFEMKTEFNLNDKVILLKPDEELLVPCKLEPQQTILIKIDQDKEVLMLSKFPK